MKIINEISQTEGIINEVDNIIENSKKIKKILQIFVDNPDIISENNSDDEVELVLKTMDIKVSDINSIVSSLLCDSKKLNSFLHEIKLLKRRREEKLKGYIDHNLLWVNYSPTTVTPRTTVAPSFYSPTVAPSFYSTTATPSFYSTTTVGL